MRKYYHFTGYENLESINENGLVPKRGGRTRSIGDKRNAIFLSLGIKNAILMYASLLHHYNSYTGNKGLEAISYFKNKIDDYLELGEDIPLQEEDFAEIEAMKEAINWINEMMEYEDFSDYLGNGVYLSISGITGMNTSDPKDCYTVQAIPPENIKVVLLKNIISGKIIDDRESILAYFMSITPINKIIDNTNNIITIKIIKELYKSKIEDILYYNKSFFEIVEVPISLYLNQNKISESINRKS